MIAALLCRGIARYSQKQYDLAFADFEHAIKLDRHQIGGYMGRASV
jgi:hypothetical protein